MAFTDEQRALLAEPLDPKLGTYRKADRGRDVSYLEGYQVIAQANRIFGFDAWGYTTDDVGTTLVGDGKGMLYWARVTVTVDGVRPRQDVGCHVLRNTFDSDGKEKDNLNNPDQHDLARKSAVTDALKRAFRSFGDQFGNSLYDRDSNIHQAIHEAVQEEQRQQRQAQRSSPSQAAPRVLGPVAKHQEGGRIPESTEVSTTRRSERGGLKVVVDEQAVDLRSQVVAGLAKDNEAAAKLPKSADEMTPEELEKTLTWLRNRARREA